MRQFAGVFAVGLASHGWQALAGGYRNQLARSALPMVEQQAALGSGRCLLYALAGLSQLGIPLILRQKRLVVPE